MHGGGCSKSSPPPIVLSDCFCLWSAGCSKAGFLLTNTQPHTKHAHIQGSFLVLSPLSRPHSLTLSLSLCVWYKVLCVVRDGLLLFPFLLVCILLNLVDKCSGLKSFKQNITSR